VNNLVCGVNNPVSHAYIHCRVLVGARCFLLSAHNWLRLIVFFWCS